MKKLMLLMILVTLFVALSSCNSPQQSATYQDYYDSLVEYQSKLQSLIDDQELKSNSYHGVPLSNGLDETKKYTKEEFMSVYQSQAGFSPSIERTEFLYIYKDLIDEVVAKLDELGIIELDVFIDVQIGNYANASIYCGYSADHSIIIKLQYDIDVYTILTAFKTGYKDDVFYVNQMNYSKEGDNINYNYSEFVENATYAELQYNSNEEFLYTSHSLLTNEEFTLQKSSQDLEGEYGAFGGYTVSWFNNETQVRNYLGFDLDNQLFQESYEQFNDHGIVYAYYDNDIANTNVRLSWNMLEASGWDYVYCENIDASNPQQLDGIYKNDIHLFEGDQINIDKNPNFSNVRVGKEFNIDELTQSQLDLTAYGLTFSTPISFDTIDTMRQDALDAVDSFANYKGFDFFGGDIATEFVSVIDPDLQFDLNFQQ